jgi:RNA polymerase sigma-70 factor (ECF subfamily)
LTSGKRGSLAPDSYADAHLVAQVRQGDERAFEALVRRHLGAAHSLACSILREAADADDVCQDAFIIALRRIDQCRAPERFRAWLLTIVRNAAREMARQRGRCRAVGLSVSPEQRDSSNPCLEAYRAEIRAALRDVVDALTEHQRSVLVLHDLEGWRHREIADELGITPGSSRVHLHNARKAMRNALQSRFSEA